LPKLNFRAEYNA